MELMYIWQKLKKEQARIMLTVFAIAWSTLTITIMLAVCHGFMRLSVNTFNQSGANNLIIYPGQTSKQYEGVSPNTPINLTMQDYQAASRALSNDVGQSSAVYSIGTQLSILGKHVRTSVLGVSPNYLSMKDLHLQAGRFLNKNDINERKPVMILGYDLAARLYGDAEKALNQTVFIRQTAFQVVGITAKKGQFDFYARQAYMPFTTLLGLYPSTKMNQMIFDLNPQADMEKAQQKITWWIANAHHVSPSDPSIVSVQNNQKMLETMKMFFLGIQGFFAIVGLVTLLAASLGITSIMFTAVKNDQAEIGLRMALGAKRGRILRYYLLESLFITVLGGVIGFVLALLFIGVFNQLHISIAALNVQSFTLSISWALFVLILCILGLAGFFAAFFPARRAANVNPSLALNNAI